MRHFSITFELLHVFQLFYLYIHWTKWSVREHFGGYFRVIDIGRPTARESVDREVQISQTCDIWAFTHQTSASVFSQLFQILLNYENIEPVSMTIICWLFLKPKLKIHNMVLWKVDVNDNDTQTIFVMGWRSHLI